ncbi:MAG TPA: arylesterase [Planctomycetota bacterium]|nr:arylesterase [Planctomycetota bacterium]
MAPASAMPMARTRHVAAASAEPAPSTAAASAHVTPPEPIRLHGHNFAKLPAKVPGVPRVLFIGDSIAAGFGLPPDAPPYPSILAQRLAAEDGIAIEVLNGGVFGFSTSGGLVLKDLGSLRPDVVVIELGGNDFLQGQDLERTRQNLRDMVASARGMGARVLLVGVRLPDFLLRTDRGSDFDRLYPALAAELDVPLVPDMFEDALGNPRFMQSDDIHPTAEGQEVVAENVLPQLRSVVLQALGR